MATADILLTPARIFYAPVGEELPDENTVDYGDEWGGNWEDLGYTLTPVTMNISRELFELFVEQLTNPVKRKITQETLTIETTLAEITGDNLLLAFGGSVTETPAGAGQVEKVELEAGGDTTPDVYAFGLEGEYVDDDNESFPVRVLMFRGNPILGGAMQFAKAAGMGIPIRITAEADTTKDVGKQLLLIQKVTADALT
ncbi:MAG: hypothetical protein PHQ60_15715 [Sideroxydans sp.]|nr:hypothetical protein [Sideroxydans sp.]